IGIGLADIRRVGDDEVKLLADIDSQQIGFAKQDPAAETQPRGTHAGNLQCVFRDVTGMDFRLWQLAGKGERNAAGTGAHVKKPYPARTAKAVLPDKLKDCFHGVLSLRAWDEHRRRHQKIKSPEFLMAGDVLRGTAAGALTNDFFVL